MDGGDERPSGRTRFVPTPGGRPVTPARHISRSAHVMQYYRSIRRGTSRCFDVLSRS